MALSLSESSQNSAEKGSPVEQLMFLSSDTLLTLPRYLGQPSLLVKLASKKASNWVVYNHWIGMVES